MNFQDKRKDFSIFTFLENQDAGIHLKGLLATAGYDSYVFTDQDTLVDRVKQAAPHVIVFSVDALMTSLSDFVQAVLQANDEVQLVCWAPSSQAEALMEYREYNLFAQIIEGDHREQRTVWAVDQACEKMYQLYLNEGLAEDLQISQVQIKKLSEANKENQKQIQFNLQQELQNYQTAESKEDALRLLMSQVGKLGQSQGQKLRCVFFKFLPTVQSLVATASHGVDIEEIKGVGAQLENMEAAQLAQMLAKQELPGPLAKVLRQGLDVKTCVVFPVMIFKEFDGCLVFWKDQEMKLSEVENQLAVFQLMYQQLHLLKKNQGLDVFDSGTELYNRNYFLKKLEEEMQRAKRLQQPLSLVRISIDQFAQIEVTMGRTNRDLILKAVAALLKKTSRVNDICCRTDENHISILLPHSGQKGSTLRAERIRRMIENHSFAMSGLKITVSCGISEYPSLVNKPDELDASVNQALQFVVSRGGNRVCLFRPAGNFKPEFDVPVEPVQSGS